jgi:NAD(P)-dependent dehydrogenase (short-subunit alcohol dehydrogenase family)
VQTAAHRSTPKLSTLHPLNPPQVAVNYASSPDKAQEVAAEIEKLGGEAITVGCNVAKKEELDALFKAVTDKWGGVDVLVNNAGVVGGWGCGWGLMTWACCRARGTYNGCVLGVC